MQQPEFLSAFITPLDHAGIVYMVTGSVAATLYGEPRLTLDIDIVIHLAEAEIPRFCALFPSDAYYCPPPEVIRIELQRSTFAHFNLIDHQSGLKADCYPDAGDELHAWAFRHKRRITLSDTSALWLAPIEYVILRKLQYYREGGSQKHISDVRNMLAVSGKEIDREFLEAMIDKLDLRKWWTAIEGTDERVPPPEQHPAR